MEGESSLPDPYNPTSSTQSPFIINYPHSEKSDKDGLREGKLLLESFKEVQKLKEARDRLIHALKENKVNLNVDLTHFKNWAGNQERVLLYVKPTTCHQIKTLVEIVNKLNQDRRGIRIKIGMGGAYHSWSPVFPDDCGLLINTCALKLDPKSVPKKDRLAQDREESDLRIILHDVEVDKETKKCVTISPGVTTGELMKFFLQNDVCFESDVILPTVTYGGVLSGGCHGTGMDQTSMSDWIVSMKVVNGEGEVITLNTDGAYDSNEKPIPDAITDKKDYLKAGQTSLGVLGVTVEFTIEVQEMSHCRVQNDFDTKLKDVFPKCTLPWNRDRKLKELMSKHWSLEIFWFPFNSLLDPVLKMFENTSAANPSLSHASLPPTDDSESIQEMAAKLVEATKNLKNGKKIEELLAKSLKEAPEQQAILSQFVVKDDHGDGSKEGRKCPMLPKIDLLALLFAKWRAAEDKLWIRKIDKLSGHRASMEPGIPFWSKAVDILAHKGGQAMFGAAQDFNKYVPPLALSFAFQAVKLQYKTMEDEIVRTPWAVHYRDAIDLMQVYDMEFAFPISKDNAKIAIDAVNMVRVYVKLLTLKMDQSFPLSLCLEMRVVKKSTSLMCPASIGDEKETTHVAFIEILSTVGTPEYEKFFQDVARMWMELGGVPHWHKQLMIDANDSLNMRAHIQKMYGTNLEKFNTVRQKFDKYGLFLNGTMRNILTVQKK